MKALQALVWVTQLGLSVVAPLVCFVLPAVWLRERFHFGSWVVFLGVILGILGAVGGLINALKALHRLPDDKNTPPKGYNDHD